MTRVLFMGRKPVAVDALRYLLQVAGAEVIGVVADSEDEADVVNLAASHAIRSFTYADALNSVRRGALSFDLGVSMLYSRKLAMEFFTVPSLGTINFHPAPLPDYKGVAGYNLAILEALKEWGVSAHYIDENIDTGAIIKVLNFPIDSDVATALSLERECQRKLLALFKSVMPDALESDSLLPTMPNKGGRYVSRREMEDLKEVKNGDDISRKIRAFWFPPFDGAYVVLNGVKYTLVDRAILQQLAVILQGV